MVVLFSSLCIFQVVIGGSIVDFYARLKQANLQVFQYLFQEIILRLRHNMGLSVWGKI